MMKVILIGAITIDGKIARGSLDPINWTSKEDKIFFARESKRVGIIIVGHNTFKAIGRFLPQRLMIVLTSKAKKLKSIPGKVEFIDGKPKEILAGLKKRGFREVIVAGGGRVNALFLKSGFIDELWLTFEPRIFGMGVSLFERETFDLSCDLISLSKINKNAFVVKYKIVK